MTLRSQNADRIRLLDGVADRLIVLGPMLRPLIEHHWVQDVARWTKLRTEADLHAHLFGRGRIPFPRTLVAAMRDMQHDRCFYCGDPLGGSVQVDHFVPWSRWPNDAIENLVLADRCNNAKSDHLAGTPHLQRWRKRLDSASTELSDIAATCGWLSSLDRSRALAQSSYMYLPTGTPLWIRGKQFELVAGPAWT